jgi:hypothetical protein
MGSRKIVSSMQALVLAVTTGGIVAIMATPAAAEPVSVSIAGRLQSELGCTGDWQSECTLTLLA